MQLTYRSQSFSCTPTTYRFVRPTAINWRYQIAGEVAESTPAIAPRPISNPAAVNWRYQIPVMP